VRPDYLPDGRVEQDPTELLDSVITAGRAALDGVGPVDAVALANQGETVLSWDRETGRPLSTAIVWQDGRASDICGELAGDAEWIAQRTGLVLDPYFSAPKMAWIRRNLTLDGVVTTTDTWLVHALTGEFVTDATTASRSLLLDIDTVEWDRELLSVFGLAHEQLPRIAACDEFIGVTNAFGAEVPLNALMVDQQAALLAQDCRTIGQTKCTYGTGAFLLTAAGPSAPRSQHGLTTSVAARLRGETSYCLDGQVFTAGSAMRWLTDVGVVSDLHAMLAQVDPEQEEDLLFVPALAGLGAPWWRSDAQASFIGLTLATTREDLVRAVLRGIAAQVVDVVDIAQTDVGERPSVLRVDGGLANSAAFMQMQCDLIQIPVEVYPSPDATALGVASAAVIGMRPDVSVDSITGSWTPVARYEPRWSADRAGDYVQRWRDAVRTSLRSDGDGR
jgi:glycerol kinase